METVIDRGNQECNFGLICTKYMLLAMNFLFIITGVMIVSGTVSTISFFVDFNLYFHDESFYEMLATIWLIVGIIVIYVGMFGLYVAFKGSTALANVYAVTLAVTFIMQTTAACFLLLSNSQSIVHISLTSMMSYYEYNLDQKANMDWIQSKFRCCGNEGPDDWMRFGRFSTPNHRTPEWYSTTDAATTVATNMMPVSCCVQYSNYLSLQCEDHFETGCFNPVHEVISESILLIGSSVLILAAVEILGIVLGFTYARFLRRSKTHRSVIIWNSEVVPTSRVYSDYTPIDNNFDTRQY